MLPDAPVVQRRQHDELPSHLRRDDGVNHANRKLDRLRAAVAVHAAAALPAAQPIVHTAAPSAIEKILRGTWHETPFGPAFVRDEWFPLDHLHGALPLRAPLDASPEALGLLLPAAETVPHASRLAFFDIETTGLSGGTGTYAFLAGLGSYEDVGAGHAFRLRQYFLADIAGERAMLSMLAADLSRFDGLVTYNGRAFDMPFVETRMTLSRLPNSWRATPHFDLLHPVRRLFKHRMLNCRLGEAERRLLRIERFDDIPGALIPAIYFDYVRAGRVAPLVGVFRHNAEDVLSLAGVLAQLAGLLAHPDPSPDDAVALARWWELERQPERACRLYRRALPWLEGGDDWQWAASRHATLCARSGDWVEAASLWERLWQLGDGAAGLALAKYMEHRARDLPAAEEVARTLLLRCGANERIHIEHRLERIQRKRARSTRATRKQEAS